MEWQWKTICMSVMMNIKNHDMSKQTHFEKMNNAYFLRFKNQQKIRMSRKDGFLVVTDTVYGVPSITHSDCELWSYEYIWMESWDGNPGYYRFAVGLQASKRQAFWFIGNKKFDWILPQKHYLQIFNDTFTGSIVTSWLTIFQPKFIFQHWVPWWVKILPFLYSYRKIT